MSVEKKSLISTRETIKKAVIARVPAKAETPAAKSELNKVAFKSSFATRMANKSAFKRGFTLNKSSFKSRVV